MTLLFEDQRAGDPQRHFRLIPFGTYTRTLALSQAGHVGTVLTALLIIALTLDLAPRAERIVGEAGPVGPIGVTAHLLWYLALRSCDTITLVLPLACFLGIWWSEIVFTQSRERIAIWNGGRSPLQSIMPLLIVGIALGALQATALIILRPAAVATQIEYGIGDYGARFNRSLHPTGRRWITLPNHMVQARIDYRHARLVDVQVFELSDGGRMTGRITAATAEPDRESGYWLFRNGSRWVASAEGAVPDATTRNERGFTEERVALPLDPLWLSNFGIEARYLPQSVLSDLAGRPLVDDPSYRTWWHVRLAQAFLPLGMILMASALAAQFFAQRIAFKPTMLVGLAGYFMHILNNTVVWLGHYGQLPPALAAWFVPLVLNVCGMILLVRLGRSRPR
jgi:lipopolysaccharide export LptBFGC system permease protein LptF